MNLNIWGRGKNPERSGTQKFPSGVQGKPREGTWSTKIINGYCDKIGSICSLILMRMREEKLFKRRNKLDVGKCVFSNRVFDRCAIYG